MKVPPGYPAARSYASGLYEPELTRLFGQAVTPGMTVVDAGANVGYYTLLASTLTGARGSVYAFEPDPVNFAYLVENLNANACSNVRPAQQALSNTTGTGRFAQDTYGAEGHLTQAVNPAATIDVATISLDAFFSNEGWPKVDLIKIDIEGSEARAIAGMRELSRRNPQLRLIMELNAHAMAQSGETSAALASLLGDLGFVNGYVVEAGLRPFLVGGGLPDTRATYNLLFEKRSESPP